MTPPAPPKPPKPAPTAAATVTRVYPVSATEGTKFTATLAGVKLPAGPAYRVTVFWGDGRTAAGTLTAAGGGAFAVAAPHTYDAPGSYAVMVRVTADARTVLSIDAKATVADARFYAGRVAQRVTAGVAFDGVVATVTDMNPTGGRATDYTATIDWGEGRTTAGRVRQASPGRFEVVGLNTFAPATRRTVTVTIRSNGGVLATAASVFLIDPPAPARPPRR